MSLSNPTLPRTLVSIPDTGPAARVLWTALLVVVGVTVIALSAQVRIELFPVPITGQTLGVLLVAAAYGSRLGGATVGAYLIAGIEGAHVFQGGTFGVKVLGGPTGGYLIGFLVAALIVGWLAERGWDRVPWLTVAAMVIGSLVIYAFGVSVLSGFVGWGKVWALGVQPFLLGDAIKVAIAAGVLPAAWRLKQWGAPR
ncbi:MAG: biotin transporter BioY [Dehalococcoidia bacterium]